ncbi:MAG TPA: RHS repeat-associated core domain-containing protein, partial [Fimbriimonadaceae bacterium]|nr:RHS repeat-associated core domain-containing protein [Fimbriimonadaceae bacterium]
DGNVKSHTNRRGQKVDYAYTGRGQLAEVKYPDGRIFTYGYDNRGNLTSAADTVTGAIAMQYDARDFMIRIDHPGGKWFAYEYNNAGKRTKRTGDDGFVLNYAYDPQGRLLRITDGNNQPAVQYTYDIVGRLWKELKGNNTWTEYLYDAASRVRQIDHYSPQGALQARFTYTYDADGNPVTQGTPEGQWTYGYDALGQLTSAQGPGYSAMFQYDAEGNRVKKVENGVAANYTTNELNQYTQIGNDFLQYDLDGHLLAREGNRSVALQFDCVGNVSSISHAGQVSSYRYNALGQLFSSERNGVTSRHVYDGGSLAADYMVSGALRSRYVFGVGLVLKQSADSISYFGYDLSGHTRTATSVSGDIVRRNAYAPFSRVVEGASNDLGEYTFSGRNGVTSEAGGLYMMGARVFDSDAGRFLSPDPIGLAGGQSNLYSYVGNSPVVRSDPAGLCGTTDTIQLSFFSGIGGTVALHQTNDGFYLTVGVGLGAGASAEVSRTKGKVEHHATALAFQAGLGPINYSHELNSSGEMTRSGGVQVGLYTRSYEFKSDGTSKTKDALGVNAKLGAWWQGTRTHKLFDFKRHCPPSKDAGKDANDKLNENPNLRDPLAKHPMQDRTAVDPNEKNGPVGVGPERYLKTLAPIEYEILFENIGNAHVQELLVVDQLPAALDWSSLELGGIIWGNQTISEFAGLQSGTFRVPLSPPANPEQPYNPDNSHLVVDVTVTFDPADGKLTWRMKTIDPQTEEPPLGVAEGFLPPNSQLDANGQFIRDGNGKPIKHPDGRGEGKVILKIRPKVAPDGTKIVNKASITFDPGPNATTIITDPFASNVLDLRAPTSSVHQLPSVVQVQPFTVRWSGDDNGGSGISSFDVLVSTNGGAYQVWQNDTTETSATFTPTNGSTYRFYSVATDKVGHVESAPGSFDTQTLASTNSWVLAAASAPATVVGGDVVTGTVTLSREAPAEGVRVQLSSNSSALIVPSSTLVPIGGITGSFPISTQPVSTTVTRHLTTSLNGSSKQVAITLTPGGLLSFSVSPTNLTAGASTTGTLRLSGPARAGGTQVTITPNTSVITAPTSVTVPEGQSSTTFTLQTSYMSTRATRTVTATLGSVSKVASLTIAPAYDLVVNPSTVQSGQNTTARVTIPNAAPSGGVSIPVTASSSALVVPQSVTIPAGQFSALFTVGTRPVGTTVGRYVTVTYNGLNKSALVTITPYSNLATLAVNPSTVKGGTNTTGTVTLDLAAPSGGAVVNLSSSTSYIAVPASVTVPAGQTTVTFTITTRAVGSTFTRAISATRAGVTRTSNITLTP